MKEGWGGHLVLLNVFAHVGRVPWCSRGPCRALVAAIFLWTTARAGTIGGPSWTGVGLHALHALPVRTSLGFRERYRSGGHVGTHVSWDPLQTTSLTAFGHHTFNGLCFDSHKYISFNISPILNIQLHLEALVSITVYLKIQYLIYLCLTRVCGYTF